MKKNRLFIAVPLPDPLLLKLMEIQKSLFQIDKQFIRLLHPEKLHITLHFLGDVKEKNIPLLSEDLTEYFSKCRNFKLTLKECGAFPSLEAPKVYWAGVNDRETGLTHAYNSVKPCLIKYGITPEKREYIPHVTLAYIKEKTPDITKKKIIDFSNTLCLDNIEYSLVKAVLFKSQLHSTGAVHSPVKIWNLQ